MQQLQERLHAWLRWSERYTKTDMVYLFRAGFWANADMVVGTILALLLSVAFANLLPREIFGTYQYLLSLAALVGALTLAGMNRAVTQSVARGFEGDLEASVRYQLRWSIVPALISFGGALYYALGGNMPLAIGLTAIGILTPLGNVFNTYIAFLNGKQEFRQVFVYSSIAHAAYYIAIFASLILSKDAVILIIANLLTNAVATILIYRHTLRTYRPSAATDPETLRYGTHLSVMNAFGTIITRLDAVLIFHFLGPAELAVYSFATIIPERLGGLFKFFTTATLPRFAKQPLAVLQRSIVQKILWAALGGGVLAALYVFAAPLVYALLFPTYLDALPYSQLYALVIITMAANLAHTALVSQRLNRALYIYNFVNPVALLVIQIPALIYFGIAGLLVAKVASNVGNIAFGVMLLRFSSNEGESPSV